MADGSRCDLSRAVSRRGIALSNSPFERVDVAKQGLMPGESELESDAMCVLDGRPQYRPSRFRVAAEQVRARVMKTDDGHVEGVLLREGLRALKDREGSVKLAAMG